MFSANPRATPQARLLRELHYDEAQEIASSGAKVLHPRCVLPVRVYRIPLYVYATQVPDLEGTHITAVTADSSAKVKAVCVKKGITLVSMESPGMWHEVGFLADAFQVFKRHGMSVDLVSTSETNVTVSLDPQANTMDTGRDAATAGRAVGTVPRRDHRALRFGEPGGRNIRGILHELGDAFGLFAEQKIYLVSQAANDLNFTFVVDEDQADRLVDQLHALLIHPGAGRQGHRPDLGGTVPQARRRRRACHLVVAGKICSAHQGNDGRDAAYVYDSATVAAAAAVTAGAQVRRPRALRHQGQLESGAAKLLHGAGVKMECVSRAELDHVFAALPGIRADEVLFTPNFAPRSEYESALSKGVNVTLDNLHALREWPELFKGRRLLVRIDTGTGRGHHHHVRTAGTYAKFGVPLSELEELKSLAKCAGGHLRPACAYGQRHHRHRQLDADRCRTRGGRGADRRHHHAEHWRRVCRARFRSPHACRPGVARCSAA